MWLDSLFYRCVPTATIGVSPECTRQVDQITRGRSTPLLQVRAQFEREYFKDIPPHPPSDRRPFRIMFIGRVDRVKYEVRHVEGVCIDLLPSHAFTLPEGDLSIVGETRQSDEELIRQILAAEEYHLPLVRLSARYHARGMSERVIVDKLHGIMRTNGDNSVRWQERFDDIKRIVRSAVQKFPVNPIGDIRHGSGDILPLTELGNADRLAAIVDSDAHYIYELDCWLHWDGAWFQDNGNSRMTSYARDVVQKLLARSKDLPATSLLSHPDFTLIADRAAGAQ